MSHVATVEVEIKDLDALEAAARRCGLELVRGQTSYVWFGQNYNSTLTDDQKRFADLGLKPGVCEHAIRIPEESRKTRRPYEIGVIANPAKPGSYMLLWDDLCRELRGYVRAAESDKKGMGKLLQMYAVEAAKRSMARQGINCREVALPNGSIRLVGVPTVVAR